MKRFYIVVLLGLLQISLPTLVSKLNAESPDDAKMAEAIEKYLASEKGQDKVFEAVMGYQQRAQKKQADMEAAKAEDQFRNPVKIDIGKSPVKGPANAKVTIVEFSDFQCPYCKKGASIMEEVLKAYPNDVKLVFKNLPLPMHPEAGPAARAALAANKQGKFWEMHDAFFENQAKLNENFYVEKAKALGLNVDKFKADMASAEIADMVKNDSAIAQQNDISGTPGFFVNGVAVKGAYPPEHFKKIIDRWLGGDTAKKG